MSQDSALLFDTIYFLEVEGRARRFRFSSLLAQDIIGHVIKVSNLGCSPVVRRSNTNYALTTGVIFMKGEFASGRRCVDGKNTTVYLGFIAMAVKGFNSFESVWGVIGKERQMREIKTKRNRKEVFADLKAKE